MPLEKSLHESEKEALAREYWALHALAKDGVDERHDFIAVAAGLKKAMVLMYGEDETKAALEQNGEILKCARGPRARKET